MKALPHATALLVSALAVFAVNAVGAPEPAPMSSTWQLDLEYHQPKAIYVGLPGQDKPKLFWYMLYTVTNRTGQDQIFVPDFVLYTSTGQIIRSGQRTPAAVFEKIKSIHNDPLLKDMTGLTGKILQGEDNARNGVAIWPDFDSQTGSFEVFIGGLSGETAQIELPSPITVNDIDPLTGKARTVVKQRVVLTKTLQLSFFVPGEAAARHQAPIKLVEKKWVMR